MFWDSENQESVDVEFAYDNGSLMSIAQLSIAIGCCAVAESVGID